MNTDLQSEVDYPERILYDLKPQSANSEVIIAFIEMVNSGKLRLLVKKHEIDWNQNEKENIPLRMAYLNTDFLIDEVANLKIEQLPSGKFTVKKVIKRYNKDRYSAIAYGLWYIKTFEENVYEEDPEAIFDFLIV